MLIGTTCHVALRYPLAPGVVGTVDGGHEAELSAAKHRDTRPPSPALSGQSWHFFEANGLTADKKDICSAPLADPGDVPTYYLLPFPQTERSNFLKVVVGFKNAGAAARWQHGVDAGAGRGMVVTSPSAARYDGADELFTPCERQVCAANVLDHHNLTQLVVLISERWLTGSACRSSQVC